MYKVKKLEIAMGKNPIWVDFEDTAVGTTLFNTKEEAEQLMNTFIDSCPYLYNRLRVVKARVRNK